MVATRISNTNPRYLTDIAPPVAIEKMNELMTGRGLPIEPQ